jgi:hypothetical protein
MGRTKLDGLKCLLTIERREFDRFFLPDVGEDEV